MREEIVGPQMTNCLTSHARVRFSDTLLGNTAPPASYETRVTQLIGGVFSALTPDREPVKASMPRLGHKKYVASGLSPVLISQSYP